MGKQILIDGNENSETIREVIDLLDKGELRVAEPLNQEWKVNEWIKKLLFYIFQFKK